MRDWEGPAGAMTRGRGRGEDGGAAGVGGGTSVWRQGMGMGNLRRDGEPEERWGTRGAMGTRGGMSKDNWILM